MLKGQCQGNPLDRFRFEVADCRTGEFAQSGAIELLRLSGTGEQMVDDKPPFIVRAGDTIYIPTAIYHSTINTGWEPLVLLAIYNPGGAERALGDLPDFRKVPAGKAPKLKRA